MIRADRPVPPVPLPARLRPHLAALVPGLIAVALMLVWAVHDGGFDRDTWYWGALLILALLAGCLVLGLRRPLPRATRGALVLFGLYVAWSYASVAWAESPGAALDGSNRALLYLLVFTLLTLLPWTAEGALAALLAFAIGIGAIAVVLLFRLAAGDHIVGLLVDGRIASPTGYYNASAALFLTQALVSVGLASRRELPAPLRGLLIALAGAGLQLGVVGQSRGWLFTLPIVLVLAAVLARDRLRVAGAAVIPAVVTLIPVHRLLHIYDAAQTPGLHAAATRAGQESLLLLLVAFVGGTLLAWGDRLRRPRRSSPVRHRLLGGTVVVVVLLAGGAGALAVTHGHPGTFISRQWRGFSHEQSANTGSHFTDVGSGRYDFWRVALDAVRSHPVGGLGQDNFADYYVRRRHTPEEPAWTHSLELRLLAHTGIVGILSFAGFLGCALAAALGARRRGSPLTAAVAAIALLPLVDWLVHGSIDWFWEMPALSGPALGFLGMAGALSPAAAAAPEPRRSIVPRPLVAILAAVAGIAATLALGIPYLAVREESIAANVRATDPAGALADLSTAARLNPLDSQPATTAGVIALQAGRYGVARQRFRQALGRDRGNWLSWLGAGLAASALGDRGSARHDFTIAHAINGRQPVTGLALSRVDGHHPVTPAEGLRLLIVVQ